MSEKTILYVGGFRLPDRNSSAIRVLGIARMLNDLGYDTKVGGKIDKEITTYSDVEFWSIEHIGARKFNQGTQIDPILNKVEEVGKDKIKAIIAYNYAPLAFYKLYKYCKKEGITLIPDITEWYLIDGGLTLDSLVRVLLTNWRIAIISPRCKNIIYAVHYMANRFNKNHSLVLPVVSNDKHGGLEPKILSELEPIEFVYAGYPGINYSKEKVDWCIKAFGRLAEEFDNFKYHIIGENKETLTSYDPSLEKYFAAAQDKILVHGWLPNDEAMGIIKKSTFVLFVRPNNRVSRVGFPGKVKEAFDLGIPIITNDTSDLSKYIHHGENGYILSGFDEKAVYNQLKAVLTSPVEKINDLVKKCCEENPFDWNNFKEPVQHFFDNLK